MTREEIIRNLKHTMEKHKNDTVNTFGTNISVMCKDILDYLEQEPCEDAISRQAVTDTTICEGISCNECSFNTCEDGQAGCLLKERIDKLPSVAIPSAEPYDFAKWVATEIFDEWEYNKDSFAEIACRKLEKLGIVRAKGDEWELVEPTCDTCEYSTAAFNPCNACKDKSEYKRKEISDHNLKMWHDIYEEEKRREGSDKECTKKI